MGILKNNFLMKLISTICLVIMLFGFVAPARVRAEDEVWGGVLLKPIISLLTGIGDALMGILHKSIQSQDFAKVTIDGTTDWVKIGLGVLAAVLGILVMIGLALITAGIANAVVAAVSAVATKLGVAAVMTFSVSTALIVGTTGGVIAGVAFYQGVIPEDIHLPMFSVSAEEIFSNKIPLFDVNFFSPNKYTKTETETSQQTVNFSQKTIFTDSCSGGNVPAWVDLHSIFTGIQGMWISNETGRDFQSKEELNNINWETCTDGYGDLSVFMGNSAIKQIVEEINKAQKADGRDTATQQITDVPGQYSIVVKACAEEKRDNEGNLTKENFYYVVKLKQNSSGEFRFTIIYDITGYGGNNFCPANITIIRESGSDNVNIVQRVEVPIKSTAAQLRSVVSTWYTILRNIALIVAMLVLIYIGIRIVIGSTAGEKAKYKERLIDWLVAICLIFIMHYIMFFAVELVEKITGLVDASTINGNVAHITLTDPQKDNAKEVLKDFDQRIVEWDPNNENVIIWKTNLAGIFRIQSQATASGTDYWAGYALCYFILVLYTIFFAFTYAKRVLYIAFLTMIAPLVAMTYPIDKITDGKAQAFDTWLKEYIFNLMIQPLHLLLYTILVTSAYQLVSESPIYALVAIGFMMPAEKLMRRFFGFEKAKTPGLLGGAAGAALAMTGLQKLTGHHSKGKHSSSSYSEKENNDNTKIRIPSQGSSTDMMLNDVELDSVNAEKTKGLSNISKQDASKANGNVNIPGNENEIRTSFFGDEEEYGDMLRAMYQQSATSQEKAREAQNAKVPEVNRAAKATMQKQVNELNQQKKKNKHRVIKTAFAVSKAYARGLGKKALRRIEKSHPIRTMARGTVGLAGGALLGLTGAALGVASGDPSKALQYTSAGALGGYSFGSGIAGSTVDTFSVNSNDVIREAERAWYGEEYIDRKTEEYIKDNLETEQNMNFLQDVGYTREDAKEFLETSATEYYRSGVKDVEDMVTIERVINIEPKEGQAQITRDEAIAATRLKKSLPQNMRDMTSEKQDKYFRTYRDTYQEKLRKKYPQWRENAELNKKINNLAESKANDTIRIMKTLETQKSSLPRM